MASQSSQQNHPPAPVLSGADRLRLRREAYLRASSGDTSNVELFAMQPASALRSSRQIPQQQAPNESMVPEPQRKGLGNWMNADLDAHPDLVQKANDGHNSESGHQKRRLSSVDPSEFEEGKKVKVKESAHAPKKEKGAVAVPTKDIDMDGAVLGEYDPSKLIIAFDTVKPHPKIEGEWVPGKHVKYDLTEIDDREFDFNDKGDIKRINVWRRQILGRNFPKMRKTRQFWLEAEKEYVIYLVTKQLKNSASAHIKWRRLENRFNNHFHGTTQRAGEKLLVAGRQKLGVIAEDRPAPWRTAPAIQGQAGKWADLKEIIRKAEKKALEKRSDEARSGNESADESSEDDDEIPDPNPDPEPFVTPRKYHRYGSEPPAKRISGSGLKKAATF